MSIGKRGGALLAILMSSVSATAFAQAPAASSPSEQQAVASTPSPQADRNSEDVVVVTAQRRSQDLLEVPLAISALNGDSLSELGITNEKVAESALALLGSHGVLGLVGVPPKPESTLNQPRFADHLRPPHSQHHRGRQRPRRIYPGAFLAPQGWPLPDRQADQDVPLAQVIEAIAAQHREECVKAILIP